MLITNYNAVWALLYRHQFSEINVSGLGSTQLEIACGPFKQTEETTWFTCYARESTFNTEEH